jgi:hypothetical protein
MAQTERTNVPETTQSPASEQLLARYEALEPLLLKFVQDMRHADTKEKGFDWEGYASGLAESLEAQLAQLLNIPDPPADYLVVSHNASELWLGLQNPGLLGRACPEYVKFRGVTYRHDRAGPTTHQLLDNGIYCMLGYYHCELSDGGMGYEANRTPNPEIYEIEE